MMEKEVFSNILQKDEKLKWVEGVNKKAFIIKSSLWSVRTFAIVGVFVAQLATIIRGASLAEKAANHGVGNVFKIWPIVWLIVVAIGLVFGIIKSILDSKNYYFAITDKRIIKRSGVFNIKFVHYSLKNIGTIEVVGSIFDSKGKDSSANLVIKVKDFHTNTDGNTRPVSLDVISLNKAYDAYKMLSEEVDGNNENFRVKIEK